MENNKLITQSVKTVPSTRYLANSQGGVDELVKAADTPTIADLTDFFTDDDNSTEDETNSPATKVRPPLETGPAQEGWDKGPSFIELLQERHSQINTNKPA